MTWGEGDRFIRDGPATGSLKGIVGEKAGGTGAAGVSLVDDLRSIAAALGEGTGSACNGPGAPVLSGCSSGNIVTPGGGEGGGTEGKRNLSELDDLNLQP